MIVFFALGCCCLGVCASALESYQAAVLKQTNLLAYYTFDQGNAQDSAGGLSGTVTSSPEFKPGFSGEGKAFIGNGADAVIGFPSNSEVQYGGIGAIEGWLKAEWDPDTDSAANRTIIAGRFPSGVLWSLSMSGDKRSVVLSYSTVEARVAIPQADQGWHHFVASFRSGRWDLFWDGEHKGEAAGGTGFPAYLGSATGAGQGWLGGIDEIAIYSTPLWPEQVAAHFFADAASGPPVIISQATTWRLFAEMDAELKIALAPMPEGTAYQWFKDGNAVRIGTNATLPLLKVSAAEAGSYALEIRNLHGVLRSREMRVSVEQRHFPKAGAVVVGGEADPADVPVDALSGVVAISASISHIVALKNDGRVMAWNVNNCCGYKADTNVPAFIQGSVVAVAAGLTHSLALTKAGRVVAWGTNDFAPHGVPVPPEAESGVIAIAAGTMNLALKADGSLVAWGRSLHIGPVENISPRSRTDVVALAPEAEAWIKEGGRVVESYDGRVVPTEASAGVVAVTAIGEIRYALRQDGSVIGWDHEGVMLEIPAFARGGMFAIAANHQQQLALKADGTVVSWGERLNWPMEPLPVRTNISAVAAADRITVAIAAELPRLEIVQGPASATVEEWQPISLWVRARGYPLRYQWRKNGQPIEGGTGPVLNLGPASSDDAAFYDVEVTDAVETRVSGEAEVKVRPVSPGAVAIYDTDGKWGFVPEAAQEGVVRISNKPFSGYAVVKDDGSVVIWGANDLLTNLPPAARSGVVDIAIGEQFAIALKSDGSVIAWGNNWFGQTAVPAEAKSGVAAVAAGDSFALALKRDGSVVAWGSYLPPTPAELPTAARRGIKAIVAGSNESISLKYDGSIVPVVPHNYDRLPEFRENFVAVDAFYNWQVALTENGSVYYWVNSQGAAAVPPLMVVPPGSGITSVNLFSLLRGDGTVARWPIFSRPNTDDLSLEEVPIDHVRAIDGLMLLGMPTAPLITASLPPQAVQAGQPLALQVNATGFPRSYQWFKEGVEIPNATNDIYSTLASPELAGSYTVVVSNSLGKATSSPPAVISVAPSEGVVVVWGDYSHSLAGTNIPPSARSGVTSVAIGPDRILALKADGSVVTWGLPWTDHRLLDVPTSAQSGVIEISAARELTFALKDDGTVVQWGIDAEPNVSGEDIIQIITGGTSWAGLKSDGTVTLGEFSIDGKPARFTKLTGNLEKVWGAVTDSGNLIGSGLGLNKGLVGVAGRNLESGIGLTPEGDLVQWGDAADAAPAARSNIVAVAAGNTHYLALRADGALFSWGIANTNIPVVARTNVTAIAAYGGFSAAVLNSSGALRARRAGEQIVLSWPASAKRFKLQERSSLGPNELWRDTTGSGAEFGAFFQQTNELSARAKWFRLLAQ